MKIGSRVIGEGQPCYIIAEVGINHNGQLDLAKQLIDVAVAAQVDAIKFQKRTIDEILTPEQQAQPYNSPNAFGATYGEHRRKLELSDEAYYELLEYCQSRSITLLASAWDKKSADFLEQLGVPAYKIPSARVTDLGLIEHVARKRKPIILSTGMSSMEEVREAVATVQRHHDQLILLQCTSTYPCENSEVNLQVIKTLREEFHLLVGYSGHERGIAVSEAAAALGAVVVERHITLDRTMKGSDHAASLEPSMLHKLVRDIRNIEKALGSPEKQILESERSVRSKLVEGRLS